MMPSLAGAPAEYGPVSDFGQWVLGFCLTRAGVGLGHFVVSIFSVNNLHIGLKRPHCRRFVWLPECIEITSSVENMKPFGTPIYRVNQALIQFIQSVASKYSRYDSNVSRSASGAGSTADD
jgi:hypothetical protein